MSDSRKYSYINIPTPQVAFWNSEGKGGSLNWNSKGIGCSSDWNPKHMGVFQRGQTKV